MFTGLNTLFTLASLSEIILLENQVENCMPKYKSISIFPKTLEKKGIKQFTDAEKAHLTRKGFRWKIIYKFKNPKTGNYDTFANTFKVNNKYHSFDLRYFYIHHYFTLVKKHLESGFTPFGASSVIGSSIEKAFEEALAVKKKEVSERTYKDYKSRIEMFESFLSNQLITSCLDLDKKLVSQFLDKFNSKNSNNYKAALSSIFSVMSDKGHIKSNFIKELRNKKEVKKSIRIYTPEEIERISLLLEKHDPILAMYVKMICYMFWRPIEIVRITKSNIDFNRKIIRENTKVKDGKTKIIPDIIYNELFDFCKNKEHFIFTPEGVENWSLSDDAKRGYFTLRFARFRKKHEIDTSLKMYNFRHTYITKAYLNLRKELSVKETIEKLSLITGHESKAIYAYIQTNDVELPEDYSGLL